MRKVILFIAMSLDGFIADAHGGVGWLAGQNAGADDMQSYKAFIKDVDTVIMGWRTYHQITAQLSPGQWPYCGLRSYVITHRNVPGTEEVSFTGGEVCALVRQLKGENSGKNIWICGGAEIVQQLKKEDLIDRYHISVIPTLLGSGIRLFGHGDQEIKLQLVETNQYNGIMDLVYEHRTIR